MAPAIPSIIFSDSVVELKPQPAAYQLATILPRLAGKRLALMVNQTSTLASGKHLVDTLLSLGLPIQKIFSVEHGFRGRAQAGEHVASGKDSATGLPIISLYGQRKKPTLAELADVDLVVFDIQDVGARFYTYISSLHYLAQACAEAKKPLLILDRPNPMGRFVDGPVLEKEHTSFVGIYPIPILHGLTVGELLGMAIGQHWLPKLDYDVAPCLNYTHRSLYVLPVAPSPNLSTQQAIIWYASLCLFEGTSLSVGRGTPYPFQVVGGADASLGTFTFTPLKPLKGPAPILAGEKCYGLDLRDSMPRAGVDLQPLLTLYQRSTQKTTFFNSFFTKLAGTQKLRKQIEAGVPEEKIRQSWQHELHKYSTIRKKYLLYSD